MASSLLMRSSNLKIRVESRTYGRIELIITIWNTSCMVSVLIKGWGEGPEVTGSPLGHLLAIKATQQSIICLLYYIKWPRSIILPTWWGCYRVGRRKSGEATWGVWHRLSFDLGIKSKSNVHKMLSWIAPKCVHLIVQAPGLHFTNNAGLHLGAMHIPRLWVVSAFGLNAM